MLDFLYDNIGAKLKSLAKWTFIVEAVASVITGLVLMSEVDILYFWVLIVGPIVAWVSSWLMYAFGELVEKTCDNERNTKDVVELLREAKRKTEKRERENNIGEVKAASAPSVEPTTHKWRCDGCGEMRTQTPCEHCGKD